MPTYFKILVGMILGLVLGLLSVNLGFDVFVIDWFAPFGTIFMRLLILVALPLVFVSLIKGIAGLKDITNLAAIGIKTVLIYICTTVIAILSGVAFVVCIQPGNLVDDSTSRSLIESYNGRVATHSESLSDIQSSSPLQPLVDLFPENMFAAFCDNGAMLQIILLAILIGCAALMAGEPKSKAFIALIDSLDSIIIKIVDIIMSFAPVGVAALIASMVVDSAGDMSLLAALGMYAFTVVIALLFLIFGFYPLIVLLFTRLKVKDFVRAMIPVQLMGFTTSSSAATLSTTMKVANEVLHLPKRVTSFTLPVGVTINMDGTSCYQAIATIFIAQVMGIDLSFVQILIIIATTTISSIGTPGVPGGSIVIVMMVLSSVGIPTEGLALILGIDRPLDMIRTSVNVTGDVAVSAIVANKLK